MTAETKEVRLTKNEQAALLDRLQLGGCIAEALTDAPEGEEPPVDATGAEVVERADALARIVANDCIVPRALSPLDCAVIADAVEGSTYAAGFDDFDVAKRRGALRTLRSLAAKLEAAGIAETISVPHA